MKYISLIIVLVLMIWTWSLATNERAFPLEAHKIVESKVEADIREFIQKRYPSTSDIYCQRLYTENVKSAVELIVHFRCTTEGALAQGEKIQQIFEGHIRLVSNDGFVSWNEVGGEIRTPELSFQNGTRVSTKGPMPSETQETAPAQAPTSAPAAPAHGAPADPHHGH